MTKAEFLQCLKDCVAAYAVTMPGLLIPIEITLVERWLEESFESSTYKPTVRFGREAAGRTIAIGYPMGCGIEVDR